ncbi:MAG: hypothetical protein J6J17_00575 [Bacilli bacterium]|nr:hypothetical protein [Bacilli bacterium]
MSNYVKGIIGALIGGVIGVIPWILVYVYGEYMFSLIAIFIGLGASFGYKKLGGVMNKKTPIIIGAISVVVVVVATLLVIPCMLILKEGYSLNGYTFELLYSNSNFTKAITHDLLVSIFFVILGIIPVINNIKREVGIEVKSEVDAAKRNENISKMKEIFKKYNAFNKESAVSYDEIKENFNDEDEKIFKQVKSMLIIKKYKDKYYFSEKNEKTPGLGSLILSFKIILIVIVVMTLITIIFS